MKRGKRIFCLILACLMLLAAPVFAAGEMSRTGKRYNVIFVTDESGSMKYTDQNKLRYDAIHRFVALMAQHGNYLGSVTFDEVLRPSRPLEAVHGTADKKAFMEYIRQFEPNGDTNIGMALKEAVRLLDEAPDNGNPSVIILLSDGKTDLSTEEAMEASLNQKAEALEQAAAKGYQVYTICLNVNGTADTQELKAIAKATNGQFREVNSAADLEEVQIMYYQMIFGAIEGEMEELRINQDGYAEKRFLVPGIGVEELNVMLEGKAQRYTLIDPSGYSYTAAELDSMCMVGNGYVNLKVEEPMGGWWTVRAHGDPGTVIDVRLLYNSDFYVTTSVSPEQDYKLDQEVRFSIVVNDRNGPITDPNKYDGFEAKIHLTVNGEETVENMVLGDGGFHYDLKLDQEGTYKAWMSVTCGKYTEQGEQVYELNVNNHAPVSSGEPLEARAYVLPFLGGEATLDLSGAATDPDGDPIIYLVEKSAFLESAYTLEGNILTVHDFSHLQRGTIVLRAEDPRGAGCTLEVKFDSTNVGMVAFRMFLIVGAFVLVFIGWNTYKQRFVPFMGTITVWDESRNSAPSELTPPRGRVSLASFGLGDCGLPPKVYFLAGGKKKRITLKCKKDIWRFWKKDKVYSPVYGQMTDKVVIEGDGLEVTIYKDSNMDEGIRVRFVSILNSDYSMGLF